MKAPRLRVQCQECGKTWATTNPGPECPRCHGTDVDLADPILAGREVK
jgi:Zn finger protein HypA/HybF involved in hydrogenase expression